MKHRSITIKHKQNNTARNIAAVIALGFVVYALIPYRTPAAFIDSSEIPIPAIEKELEYKPVEKTLRTRDSTAVYEFVNNYPGSRLKGEYIELLNAECNGDTQLLRQLVAIATAETAQGRETPLKNNFWGWHTGGNKWHDPSREEMASEIVQGISAYYRDVGNNSSIADIYTGGDSTSTWLGIYQWAMNEMAD